MQLNILLLLYSFALCFTANAQIRIENPRIENLPNPLGLDVMQPPFGWQISANRRNVLQPAYELRV